MLYQNQIFHGMVKLFLIFVTNVFVKFKLSILKSFSGFQQRSLAIRFLWWGVASLGDWCVSDTLTGLSSGLFLSEHVFRN
jgi:hypothetical protein